MSPEQEARQGVVAQAVRSAARNAERANPQWNKPKSPPVADDERERVIEAAYTEWRLDGNRISQVHGTTMQRYIDARLHDAGCRPLARNEIQTLKGRLV